jgi:hypothetical protein
MNNLNLCRRYLDNLNTTKMDIFEGTIEKENLYQTSFQKIKVIIISSNKKSNTVVREKKGTRDFLYFLFDSLG